MVKRFSTRKLSKSGLLYQITRLLTIIKMIFFVESSAISYCPVCGEPLSYRDSCVRIMRLEGGMRRRFLIRCRPAK